MAYDAKAGFDPAELKIKAKAKIAHDKVCKCDPKYLMSCTKMAQAILKVSNG